MARPGLTQHRKFLRLARVLGSAPLALGVLEFMWEKGYQNGDPYIGDEIDVEAACEWNGEPGILAKALLGAGGDGNNGFIEPAPGRLGYQIHDLFDHAPRYVGTRLEREIARQEKGVTLSKMRSDAGKKGAEASKRAATERSIASQQVANEQQLNATPLPAPAPKEEKTVPALPERSEKKPAKVKIAKLKVAKPEEETLESILGPKDSQNCIRFWKFAGIWPKDRNPGPKSLARAWNHACTLDEPVNIYHGALNYRDGFLPPKRDKDETQFMKAPLTWLQEEGWQAQLDPHEVANA